ncbi:hypothetical protein, partial [Bordetella pertussis]|uniref:hypothetical protein n=1 Tax=Bordetella pertussis TaxID=520 RepID=UPI0021CB4F1A
MKSAGTKAGCACRRAGRVRREVGRGTKFLQYGQEKLVFYYECDLFAILLLITQVSGCPVAPCSRRKKTLPGQGFRIQRSERNIVVHVGQVGGRRGLRRGALRGGRR